MEKSLAERISANPDYQRLKATRSGFGWKLTIAMLVVYYGYIMLIAFNKSLLAHRLGEGVMTWGIPIGFGVIIFTILITSVYIRRANSEFDELSARIRLEALK
ncbi:DUF485 domain-containing protein [Paracoccus sp. (in: a-proteobacteria)]|uniref:DUF485 domain-containing protein n=1 Tax=Paracoccus sp. TaxID=267 RepID=UPI003A8B71C4